MTTVAALTEQVTILARTGTINPDTGGTIEGPPTVVATVRAAIVPQLTVGQRSGGTERLSEARLGADLGILNTATHAVTLWYRPDVTVGDYVEYADPKRAGTRRLEITGLASPDERGQWLTLACVERQG